MKEKEIAFYPENTRQWRRWLHANHDKEQSVWLILYKIQSGMPTISWSEAVDEALCYGWIDSKAKPIDDEKYMQFFSRRKAGGTWSKVNKEKITRLIDAGLMMDAGHASIEAAKRNGTWTILDEVEELIIPKDLEKAFKKVRGSKAFYLSLSRSVRKMMLQWLVLAKQAETRQRRIDEIVESAGLGMRPRHMR